MSQKSLIVPKIPKVPKVPKTPSKNLATKIYHKLGIADVPEYPVLCRKN
jgi:hypothetical protein